MSDDVTCQFCGEGDFDLIGLKMHLRFGWCEAFEAIPSVAPQPLFSAITDATPEQDTGR